MDGRDGDHDQSASARHQLLAAFVFRILARFVELHDLGLCFQAPFQHHLPHSGREPDLLFVARDHVDQLQPPGKPNRVEGPADLLVEVVSVLESVERDRKDKFKEYRQGRVPEYWILDPDNQQADFYQLDARYAYRRIVPDRQGVYRSRSVSGFWVNVNWFWHDPLPDVDQILREIAPAAHARDLAARADDAYVRTLLNQLRQQGKLPGNGR
jgi:Uma2 family endonuclease